MVRDFALENAYANREVLVASKCQRSFVFVDKSSQTSGKLDSTTDSSCSFWRGPKARGLRQLRKTWLRGAGNVRQTRVQLGSRVLDKLFNSHARLLYSSYLWRVLYGLAYTRVFLVSATYADMFVLPYTLVGAMQVTLYVD